MTYVSQNLIEETWQIVGALEARRILRMQEKHRKLQQPMSAFFYNHILKFREDAAGVGIYVYHVVVESFLKAVRRPKRVKKVQIETAWRGRKTDGEKDPQEVINTSPEQPVMQYVYDALYESEDEDVVLSDDERPDFVTMLAAVVDCLHLACSRK